MKALLRWLEAFDADDDPREPVFDPVHLAMTLLGTLIVSGCLFWLLWTLLVFEGGLFAKLVPMAQVALRLKSPADFGYKGPWDRGLFEGLTGNLTAFVLLAVCVSSLYRLYASAAKKKRG